LGLNPYKTSPRPPETPLQVSGEGKLETPLLDKERGRGEVFNLTNPKNLNF